MEAKKTEQPSHAMKTYLDVRLEVRIKGDRISGFFHPKEYTIYKDRWNNLFTNHLLWAIYNDLSRGHPKWWWKVRESPQNGLKLG